MRIGVITDAHANLPALIAALAALDAAGCDEIIHLGDAIGIGPHPREVLELLLSRNDLTLLQGNHDQYFSDGIPDPLPRWMSPGEAAHQRWVHAQLVPVWRDAVGCWPLTVDRTIGDLTFRFQHYALIGDGFASVSRDNLPAELDAIFQPETDVVMFGHHHPRADVQGRARYINPGALGCHPGEGARYALIDVDTSGHTAITLHAAPYHPATVFADLESRDVPEREFIRRVFLA